MVTDIHDGGRQPGDEETTGAEVIPFRRTRATSRQDEPDAPETAHAAFGAQLAGAERGARPGASYRQLRGDRGHRDGDPGAARGPGC